MHSKHCSRGELRACAECTPPERRMTAEQGNKLDEQMRGSTRRPAPNGGQLSIVPGTPTAVRARERTAQRIALDAARAAIKNNRPTVDLSTRVQQQAALHAARVAL